MRKFAIAATLALPVVLAGCVYSHDRGSPVVAELVTDRSGAAKCPEAYRMQEPPMTEAQPLGLMVGKVAEKTIDDALGRGTKDASHNRLNLHAHQ